MKHLFLFLMVTSSSMTFAKSPLRFDAFEIHKVTPETMEQIQALREFKTKSNGFDFLGGVPNKGNPVDILVPPHLKYDFEDFLELQKLNSEVMTENLQELIDNERTFIGRQSQGLNWNGYYTLEEINDWLESLPGQYPGIVSTIVGGESYEGRNILGIKISFKTGNKGVFLEGGIHAREWIVPATLTFIANQLLTSNDTAIRAVAESRDWYIFPSVNPDGYVYTQTNRLWRKSRKPYGVCIGADPNRNWGYHWMEGGSSSNPCSQTFAGSSAFSEIETKSLSEYISTIAKNLDIYLGFHSYSQLLLIPYGHGGLEKPQNNQELLKVGEVAVNKLAERYGTLYKVGNIPETIDIASGSSSDWVLGTYKDIRLVYTFELRDTGRYGFILPPEQIIPTGEETLDAIVSIVQQADQK